MVVDREEAELGTGQRPQLLVGDALEAALRVLHHDDGVDAEHVRAEGEAAQDVLGDAATGVADDVRLAEVEAERREDVDASVHARDDGEVTARTGVGDVRSRRGVGVVRVEQASDLGHAVCLGAPPASLQLERPWSRTDPQYGEGLA